MPFGSSCATTTKPPPTPHMSMPSGFGSGAEAPCASSTTLLPAAPGSISSSEKAALSGPSSRGAVQGSASGDTTPRGQQQSSSALSAKNPFSLRRQEEGDPIESLVGCEVVRASQAAAQGSQAVQTAPQALALQAAPARAEKLPSPPMPACYAKLFSEAQWATIPTDLQVRMAMRTDLLASGVQEAVEEETLRRQQQQHLQRQQQQQQQLEDAECQEAVRLATIEAADAAAALKSASAAHKLSVAGRAEAARTWATRVKESASHVAAARAEADRTATTLREAQRLQEEAADKQRRGSSSSSSSTSATPPATPLDKPGSHGEAVTILGAAAAPTAATAAAAPPAALSPLAHRDSAVPSRDVFPAPPSALAGGSAGMQSHHHMPGDSVFLSASVAYMATHPRGSFTRSSAEAVSAFAKDLVKELAIPRLSVRLALQCSDNGSWATERLSCLVYGLLGALRQAHSTATTAIGWPTPAEVDSSGNLVNDHSRSRPREDKHGGRGGVGDCAWGGGASGGGGGRTGGSGSGGGDGRGGGSSSGGSGGGGGGIQHSKDSISRRQGHSSREGGGGGGRGGKGDGSGAGEGDTLGGGLPSRRARARANKRNRAHTPDNSDDSGRLVGHRAHGPSQGVAPPAAKRAKQPSGSGLQPFSGTGSGSTTACPRQLLDGEEVPSGSSEKGGAAAAAAAAANAAKAISAHADR